MNEKNQCVVIILLTTFCLLTACAGSGQKILYAKDGGFINKYLSSLLLKKAEPFEIYVYEQIQDSFVRFNSAYRGANIKISPKGTYISFWGTDNKNLKIFDENKGWDNDLKLCIFFTSGELYKTFTLPMGGLEWSPNEDKFAYIEAPYYEGKNLEHNTIKIVDIKSGQQVKIPENSQSISWAKFDANIYFFSSRKNKVMKLNPVTYEIEETNYKGIDFTDNGAYYFSYSSEKNDVKVYNRKTNIEITPTIEAQLKNESDNERINWTTTRWDESNNLVFSDLNLKTTYIFNPDKKILLQGIEGYYLGVIDAKANKVAVIQKNQVQIKTIDYKSKQLINVK